jgi:hypothetical protein
VFQHFKPGLYPGEAVIIARRRFDQITDQV